MPTFQQIILSLQSYWDRQGCALLQPYDMEVGAGTSHTATFLRALGPEPWRAAYVQPSRRPKDGRYGENPNRTQHYYQYQVVLKPSPETPLDPYLLGEAILEAEIPPGVINIVAAGRETSEYLVSHPGVDKVSFTGSSATGRCVASLCGEGLKRCTLELGGKSAAILLEDFDVEAHAVPLLASGSRLDSPWRQAFAGGLRH